ncbi:MAG: monovalent cation/H+ antiporter complex subunit F [Thermoanaerobaculales bacterium]|jgi:multicomponent Na+:H+ antiporter subunit F|nr:monovalent cation/H+ antiporter complex subunit F [Thermoanaerobaculales bacterium]
MNAVWWIAACALLVNIGVSLGVMMRRRTTVDPLLAVLLFGTAGVALLVVLAEALDAPRGLDVALVLALLAAVFGVAAVRMGWFGDRRDKGAGR